MIGILFKHIFPGSLKKIDELASLFIVMCDGKYPDYSGSSPGTTCSLHERDYIKRYICKNNGIDVAYVSSIDDVLDRALKP